MYAIDWAHKVAGLEPPSNHPLVKSIVDAGHRVYGKSVVKKEPITSDLVLRLVSSYSYTRKLTFYSSRTLELCSVSFAGFLRFDEISNLKCHEVEIKNEYMLIFIESSKTDQYRDGAWLPISRTNNSTCPVANLEKYSELAQITFKEPSHLFRGITFKKDEIS